MASFYLKNETYHNVSLPWLYHGYVEELEENNTEREITAAVLIDGRSPNLYY